MASNRRKLGSLNLVRKRRQEVAALITKIKSVGAADIARISLHLSQGALTTPATLIILARETIAKIIRWK